jgi:hypothetical protein
LTFLKPVISLAGMLAMLPTILCVVNHDNTPGVEYQIFFTGRGYQTKVQTKANKGKTKEEHENKGTLTLFFALTSAAKQSECPFVF